MRRSLLFIAITLTSCGGPPARVQLPAPNPGGCYVIVYDRPEFHGMGDVWNGPGRWSSLEVLRHTRPDGWRNRIRSLRVGRAATVTVFTESDFRGESSEFAAQTDHAHLDQRFSGRIQSLQLSCQ
jgi:hypothetical protein